MISAEKKMLLAQQVEAIARKAGKWMAGHKISQVTTKGEAKEKQKRKAKSVFLPTKD